MGTANNPTFADGVTILGDGTVNNPLATSGAVPSGFVPLQKATLHLTAAQIKALRATPIVIIPGTTGKKTIVFQVQAKYNFVTTAYTIPADSPFIGLGTPTQQAADSAIAALTATGFIDQTASKDANSAGLTETFPGFAPGVPPQAGGENIEIFNSSQVAEFTVGDGTLDVTVFYALF